MHINKIENYSTINHNRPAFTGMYIVKGTAINTCKAVNLIAEKSSEFAQYEKKDLNYYYPKFTQMRKILLSSSLDNLPITRYLVGTNEHAQNIVNWFRETESEHDSLELLLDDIKDNIKNNKKLRYLTSEEDFIKSNLNYANKLLEQVKKFATVPYDEPKTVEAVDVIDAISKDKFNYITGEIIK